MSPISYLQQIPIPSNSSFSHSSSSPCYHSCSSRVVGGIQTAPATPRGKIQTEKKESGIGKNSVSVVDNRTGSSLLLPINSNTIRADGFKHLRSPLCSSVLRLYDPGYMNTSLCVSRICFIDGDKGVLTYRGYPIEELADQPDISYEQVAFLLLYAELPTAPQLRHFSFNLTRLAVLPSSIKDLIRSFSPSAHPMGILMAAMAALGTCHPESNPALAGQDIYSSADVRNREMLHILGLMPTLAATIHRHREGLDLHDPDMATGGFARNFMNLLDRRSDDLPPSSHPVLVKAMDVLFILHAEHELNCSTAAVRHLSSSNADVYTAIAGGIGALYGPRHGGANEAVVRMLEEIGSVQNIPQFLQDVKDRKKKLMGFGHRVYKSYDPRARLVRSVCEDVFKLVGRDPLLDIAVELERTAITSEFFKSRQLYPNVDFYSGLIYRAMGFDTDFFPVLFAVGRIAGWLAHWSEFQQDSENRIVRPFQVYQGPSPRSYVPLNQRNELISEDKLAVRMTASDGRRVVSKL
eukprot:GHVS01076240.1.p1 GENE.GHVS01076240.1~~GHVS01076240.1.p1  ORF type:complete len:544 (-),score=64.85 GHVS01076240.1:318-1883(-)